jgi:hypothetical protein
MTTAMRSARCGVLILRIPNLSTNKVLKYYEWLARYLPTTKADCDLRGKVVEATDEGITVLEGDVEIDIFTYPETRKSRSSR